MSKVLVDPAALKEAAKWLEVHSSSSGSAEAFAADALREAIGQPAEAEGVDLHDLRALVVGHTPLPNGPVKLGNVLHIDTAGWHPSGRFTLLDLSTLQIAGA